MLRPFSILTAALALASLAVGAQAQTSFRLACPSAPTTPTCKTASYFAEQAAKESGGSLDVKVFPSGQLGTGKKAILGMQTGSIDMAVETLVNYARLVKDYGILGWGFTFKDTSHLFRFLDSPVHGQMRQELKDKGIVLLAYKWRKLPRVVVSRDPVFTPDDLAGLKFRVPGIKTYVATWESLGANPANVPWGESYMALRQGTVDAMESPFGSIIGQKFHQAAKYVTMTNHVQSVLSLGMNAQRFDSLSDADKAALTRAVEATNDYAEQLVQEERRQAETTILNDGAYVIRLDPTPFAVKLEAAAADMEKEGLWRPGLLTDIQKLR